MAVTLRLFNKNIITRYTHIIMSARAGEIRAIDSPMEYYTEQISYANLGDCANSNFSTDIMYRYLKKQPGIAKGYLFKDKYSGNAIGYLWLMKKGGNEIQYKVRKADAFLFDAFVFEKYRGKRFVSTMISYVAENDLKKTDFLRLAVRKDNEAAIKAYQRSGFECDGEKSFVRILKMNFPYHRV